MRKSFSSWRRRHDGCPVFVASKQQQEVKMSDEKPNHAQSIEGVLGTFEGELRKLSDRAASIQKQTVRLFGDAHATFDHAEHINDVVGKATARLSRFLGPPPNSINMPKQIEDATILENE